MYKDITAVDAHNSDVNAINNSIRNIILTRRGSVPGKPRFGSDLYTLLFSQLDTLTESVAKSMIFACLTEFEDRIKIIDISLKSIEEYNKLVVTVNYRYKDNLGHNLAGSTAISLAN